MASDCIPSMDSATAYVIRKALIHMLNHGGRVSVRVEAVMADDDAIIVLEDDSDDLRPFVQGAEVRILAASVTMRDG